MTQQEFIRHAARECLRASGVSQADAARRLGVSRAYVSTITAGGGGLGSLLRLADVCGCKILPEIVLKVPPSAVSDPADRPRNAPAGTGIDPRKI